MIEKIKSSLILYSIWMHLSLILALSYIFMQLTRQLGGPFFLGWILGFLIYSIPILLFVLYRDLYKPEYSWRYWGIFSLIFLVYPSILFYFKIDLASLDFLDYLFHLDIDGTVVFPAVCLSFFILEILLHFSKKKTKDSKTFSISGRVNAPRLAIITVTIFTILLLTMNRLLSIELAEKSVIESIFYTASSGIQMFVIYISYYMYYYIHHHILFNGLLKQRGLIAYLLGLIMVILLLVPIHNFIISLFPVVENLKLHSLGLKPQIFDDFNYSTAIFTFILSFPLIVVLEWYKQKNALNELEKQKSRSELNLLKSQINPHFFFNTLNNLYAMSLTKDEETPEAIMKLSELMRYVIYKGKEDTVKLKDEIKYIKDYIEIQMIRSHKSVDFTFDINVDDLDVHIPPLLFIIFIENAFKHGIEPAENNCFLHLDLSQNKDEIIFICKNSIEEEANHKNGGIGLQNLKKRLEILYPQCHELKLLKTDKVYTSVLKIKI